MTDREMARRRIIDAVIDHVNDLEDFKGEGEVVRRCKELASAMRRELAKLIVQYRLKKAYRPWL